MKTVETAEVISMQFLTDEICDLKIRCPQIAENAKAGQFLEIYPDNGINLLARPISICEKDSSEGTIRLVFRIAGKGTALFSRLKRGDKARVMGPCGNGYNIENGKKAVLVGGGIGIPPLLELCKEIRGEKIVVLGFASQKFLADDFEKTGAGVYISTDDGSAGFKGNVLDLLKSENIQGDIIYSCGPKIMLKLVSLWAEERNIECFISVEERMACGIGACVGCAIKIMENGKQVYKKVCKDGPVFSGREVIWE